jgi:hypothetical protein
VQQLWVSSPTDRILRGGGSVVVSSAGAITATPIAGQAFTVVADTSGDAFKIERPSIRTWGIRLASGNFNVYDVTAGFTAMALTIGSTGSAQFFGTGTHTYSGPVKVSVASGNPEFVSNWTGADGSSPRVWGIQRGGAYKFDVYTAGTSYDTVFRTLTGTAGSESATEALRIINTGAYVTVLNRLGVGLAAGTSPSYPLHVASAVSGWSIVGAAGVSGISTTASQGAIQGEAQATTAYAGFFRQTAASATAPVLVVKGGATPSSGGDLAQFRKSDDSAVIVISSSGGLTIKGDARILEMEAKGSTPGAASSTFARLWYDDTAKRFKYIDSVGTTYTITAA